MPLDFTHAHAPRTLGRTRTKDEIKEAEARARRKKYDIKSGLRDQGGFTDSFREWDRKKQKEYASIIARQEEQHRSQFGDILDDWVYFTDQEAKQCLEDVRMHGLYERDSALLPSVSVMRNKNKRQWEITVALYPAYVKGVVTEEELRNHDNIELLEYEVSYMIKRLADEVSYMTKRLADEVMRNGMDA